MKKLFIAAILSLLPSFAFAADVNSPAVKAIADLTANSACTPTSCTGWYAGVGLGGVGTNLNVIGNGLDRKSVV